MGIKEERFPKIGVGVVVWRGGRFLVVRRKQAPRAGEWALPGGKQQWGETVREAAAREVREETGVEISIRGVVTVLDSLVPDDEGGGLAFHYTLVEVGADWVSGEAVAGDDAGDVRWVTVEEAEGLCAWAAVAMVARMSRGMMPPEDGSRPRPAPG